VTHRDPAVTHWEPSATRWEPCGAGHHPPEVRPSPGVEPGGSMVARGGMSRFWSLESLQMGTCE